MTDITVAIDKLDKIGLDKVKEELAQRGLNEGQVATIGQYLAIEGSNAEKLAQLRTIFAGNETGVAGSVAGFAGSVTGGKGIEELEWVLEYAESAGGNASGALIVDLTLARGLNYYTGLIFEVRATRTRMGSIGGGGRYDDLTGLFGVPNIPGVGISFGVDRIYDVMEEEGLFPEDVHTGTRVLFFHLGEAESRAAFSLLQQLRAKGVSAELYHEQAKFDKQFKYAEKKAIPYAVIIGNKELADGTCVVRDLGKGNQETLPQTALLEYDFLGH